MNLQHAVLKQGTSTPRSTRTLSFSNMQEKGVDIKRKRLVYYTLIAAFHNARLLVSDEGRRYVLHRKRPLPSFHIGQAHTRTAEHLPCDIVATLSNSSSCRLLLASVSGSDCSFIGRWRLCVCAPPGPSTTSNSPCDAIYVSSMNELLGLAVLLHTAFLFESNTASDAGA